MTGRRLSNEEAASLLGFDPEGMADVQAQRGQYKTKVAEDRGGELTSYEAATALGVDERTLTSLLGEDATREDRGEPSWWETIKGAAQSGAVGLQRSLKGIQLQQLQKTGKDAGALGSIAALLGGANPAQLPQGIEERLRAKVTGDRGELDIQDTADKITRAVAEGNPRARIMVSLMDIDPTRINSASDPVNAKRLREDIIERIRGPEYQGRKKELMDNIFDLTGAMKDLGVAGRIEPWSVKGITHNVLQSAVQMAPGMGLAMFTRSPYVGMMAISGVVDGTTYADSIEMGLTPSQARFRAGWHALAELATGPRPLNALLADTGFMRKVLKSAAEEGLQEPITQILQSGYDYVAVDDSITVEEFLNDVAYSAAVGAGSGAMFGSIGGTVDFAAKKVGGLVGGEGESPTTRFEEASEEAAEAAEAGEAIDPLTGERVPTQTTEIPIDEAGQADLPTHDSNVPDFPEPPGKDEMDVAENQLEAFENAYNTVQEQLVQANIDGDAERVAKLEGERETLEEAIEQQTAEIASLRQYGDTVDKVTGEPLDKKDKPAESKIEGITAISGTWQGKDLPGVRVNDDKQLKSVKKLAKEYNTAGARGLLDEMDGKNVAEVAHINRDKDGHYVLFENEAVRDRFQQDLAAQAKPKEAETKAEKPKGNALP